MPHHREQNVFGKMFIRFVRLDIIRTKGASRKEEALALECRHSSGIAQGFTAGQSQTRRGRCGIQIANKQRQLCLDPCFRRRVQLLASPESVRPLAEVVKGRTPVPPSQAEFTSPERQCAAAVAMSRLVPADRVQMTRHSGQRLRAPALCGMRKAIEGRHSELRDTTITHHLEAPADSESIATFPRTPWSRYAVS
jgi:hypothetical protein